MNAKDRKFRSFWAITEENTIQQVVGYECPQNGYWWVPTLGHSMCEGYSLFDSQVMAKTRLKGKLRAQISELEQQISALI